MPAREEAGVVEPWEDLDTELVINTDEVKAWIETVPPGGQRPAHTHRHPWVTVVLSGARGESLDADGNLIKNVAMETGQIVHNTGENLPMRHYVRNLDDHALVMVAIELRRT
jgi:hypothetical protein